MSTIDAAETAMSEAPEGAVPPVVWDGLLHSYRPQPDWMTRVSPKLEFYGDEAEDLDPITYEVIRNRLWTMNLAHGETLTRISGSPVFQSLDFNMAVLTEDAEIVMNAPYLQCLVTGVPLAIKYIMETFSDAPGIHEGDMFLSTDPWTGAVHQMDVLIACPVFVEGKLFGWVSNAGHQYDLGGIVPGGWPQNAPDVYSEPIVLPPIKFIERGVMRSDLELMFRRQSRVPDLVALDLRAQIAGCRFAARQLTEACEQFGAPTVKAAMKRILDTAQRSFANKLEQIPDGTWSEVRYFDEKMPGDRTTHRSQVTVTKRGDRITIDNAGTDPQTVGPTNFVYAAFAGQILGALAVTMLHEQMFSVGGAERQVDFAPTPGLITCADYPAAISGGVNSIVCHTNGVMQIIGRMLSAAPELKDDVIAGGPGWPLLLLEGTDDRGNFFGTALMDAVAMGSGARSHRDGVDTGGPTWSPLINLLNIEGAERWYPVVYLYRRELEDGGGAGRWRGGTGMEFAFTPYRAASMQAITNTSGMDISTHGAMGLYGGYPSPTAHYKVLKGTDLAEFFGRREIPADVDDLAAADSTRLRAKSNGTVIVEGDVVEARFSGGGGYGDPLEREPARVIRDVGLGYVSRASAEQIYGIALTAEGALDDDGTRRRRDEIRAERGGWKPASGLPDAPAGDGPSTAATGEPPRHVHEYVVTRDEGDQRVLACACCDAVLGDHAANYKHGLLVDEGSPTLIPLVRDPSYFIDEDIVFRRFCCPGCRTLLTSEIARRAEPAQLEMAFAAPGR